MKKTTLLLALIGLPMLACAADFEITVERKKDALGQLQGNVEKSASQRWSGDVKVANRSFKASPELQARYIIFVKRQELGQKPGGPDHVEKIKGDAKVAAIKPGEGIAFVTSEVELRQQRLDSGWYYGNGGSSKADDGILGIWVKLFNGAVEVAEYVNPSTIKGKYKWEQ